MKLSVVIPAYNEAANLPLAISTLFEKLQAENIDHEILIVNDNSGDDTVSVLEQLMQTTPTLRYVTNPPPYNGFGFAVRRGLDSFSGDCVAIVMADLSDSPDDLVLFYRTMLAGNYDCVFGSRFIRGGKVYDYPWLKKELTGSPIILSG